MNAPFIIGIAGGSASGKSTLSSALIDSLKPQSTILLPHDAYYRGAPHGTDPTEINYDHPDSLESSLCAEHLQLLREGRSVSIPQYDFSKHCRKSEVHLLEPGPIVIVEGILVLHESSLRMHMDLRIYVDTAEEIRFERRLKRDGMERGRTRESILLQWESTVMPMHREYVEPSKYHAHMIIDGTSIGEREVRELAEMVKRSMRLA